MGKGKDFKADIEIHVVGLFSYLCSDKSGTKDHYKVVCFGKIRDFSAVYLC